MAAFLAAGLIYLACLPIGAAALKACRREPRAGYGPAVGLALLIVVDSVAIRLPGEATTSVLATAALLIASIAFARADLLRPPHPAPVVAAVMVLIGVSIPFIAAGAVGIQGVAINFDMSVHVGWAETLRTGGIEPLPLPTASGYPLGPHAVVATAGAALGIETAEAFIGLLMVVPLLALGAALALFERLSPWPRALAATAVALPYLMAAYYGQGAFKETVEGLFLVAFLAVVREMALARRLEAGGLGLLALIAGGSFYNYSYLGLTWFLAALGVWVALELAFGEGWLMPAVRDTVGGLRRIPRRTAIAGGVAAAVFAALLAPEVIRALDFFNQVSFSPNSAGGITSKDTGNLAQALSPYEALGIWPNDDFRTYFESARTAYRAGLAGGVGVLGVAIGALWWLRRRDFVVPAAAIGAAAIFLYLKAGDESPYVEAKALAVLAPVAVALAVGGLLGARADDGPGRATLALGAVFLALAGLSSFLVLRGSYVGPPDHPDELASLRPLVAGKNVLALPTDFFANTRLHGARVSGSVIPQPVKVDARPEKPFTIGRPLDFDWVTPRTLDRFDFVVAARGRYASEPPANFRRVRTTRSYELWRRTGRTPDRRILAGEHLDPGAILDCRSDEGRRLRRQVGWARIWPAPSLAIGPPGRRLPRGIRQSLRPGQSVARRLRLPPGRYELSLIYNAPRPPHVTGTGVNTHLVAQLDPAGPFWRAADIDFVGGTLPLRVDAAKMHLGGSNQVTDVGELAAVRLDDPRRLVPLRAACGRYVDWYVLGRDRPPVPRGI